MSHAFGEMYYLAMQVEHKRQIEMKQKVQKQGEEQEQKRDPRKGALVFISPRVPKDFDTVVPSDTGKSVETTIHTDDPCVIA
jgi:hypothetical protein